jgi:ubiquitin-protein ligase
MDSTKRILKELQQIEKDPLDHIFIDYSESNIRLINVLMIGERNTPYSRMFLRFQN